jgi:hypothetical protein
MRTLALGTAGGDNAAMVWTEPYLETCCRSALHRLLLCGDAARPPGMKDGPCLTRLAGLGLARQRPDGRFELTPQGYERHAREIARPNNGQAA